YLGVQLNVPGKHLDALTGIEVDDVDAALSQPFDPAGKIPRLAHDYCPDLELPDQTAAIPARRQRGYHDLVAVRRQPASLAKCIRLAMDRRVIPLTPPVMPTRQKMTSFVEHCRSDRYTAFVETLLGLFYCDLKQVVIVESSFH